MIHTTTDTDLKVKEYLAHWFQLGKKLVNPQTNETILPQPIYQNGEYSRNFEQCWQYVTDPRNGNFYLEGMPQSIQELLSPQWELVSCARCDLPVPLRQGGNQSLLCPCHDLDSWPNTELPQPRRGINSTHHLKRLGDRLQQEKIAQDTCDRLQQEKIAQDTCDRLWQEHNEQSPERND